MNAWKDKTALITGASSGIGAATARLLAAQGMSVVLAARRADRLEAVTNQIRAAGGQAKIMVADLSREVDRRSLFEHVMGWFDRLDVLVNNAGLGWYGYFSEMSWQTIHEMLAVNIEAVAHLTGLFLPGMLAHNNGHIINVGSIVGAFPNQGVAVYSATKAFLDAFTTSLYRETGGTRVHVSVVRAGPVQTEFCLAALQHKNGLHLPTEKVGITAEMVARRILGLIQRPRRVVYIPRSLSLAPWVELTFGWLIDQLGPLLLKHERKP